MAQMFQHHRCLVESDLLHRPGLLGEWLTTAKVLECWFKLAGDERKSLDSGSDETVEVGWDTLGCKLVEQASGLGPWSSNECAVLDVVKVEQIETAVSGRATEEDWVLDILRNDLSSDIRVRVWLNSVGLVVWDLLIASEDIVSIGILLSTEEGHDGSLVRNIIRSAWHQLVQERGGPEEQERKRTEVEVGVFLQRLLVSLVTVLGKSVPIIEAPRRFCHHLEKGPVEAEVVTVTEEVIVPSEGSVSFKLVVTIKTWLAASESRIPRGSVGSITTNGKFLGLEITISECETEESEKIRQIVANVVKVLLSIDKLIEGGDTITSKKVVVGSSV
jgi:hypothetical protein